MNADNKSPYNATVIGREEINPQLLVLRVQPDGGAVRFQARPVCACWVCWAVNRACRKPQRRKPAPEPDKMIRRAYSIASSSVERRYVEFYLTLITSGQLTPRLFALKHGSRAVSRTESQRRVHAGPRPARQSGCSHRHRDRSGALHFDAADDAGERDPTPVCGPARRALWLGPGLSRRTRKPGPAAAEPHLHSQHHAARSRPAFSRAHRDAYRRWWSRG